KSHDNKTPFLFISLLISLLTSVLCHPSSFSLLSTINYQPTPRSFTNPEINHLQLKIFFTVPFVFIDLENYINRTRGFEQGHFLGHMKTNACDLVVSLLKYKTDMCFLYHLAPSCVIQTPDD